MIYLVSEGALYSLTGLVWVAAVLFQLFQDSASFFLCWGKYRHGRYFLYRHTHTCTHLENEQKFGDLLSHCCWCCCCCFSIIHKLLLVKYVSFLVFINKVNISLISLVTKFNHLWFQPYCLALCYDRIHLNIHEYIELLLLTRLSGKFTLVKVYDFCL